MKNSGPYWDHLSENVRGNGPENLHFNSIFLVILMHTKIWEPLFRIVQQLKNMLANAEDTGDAGLILRSGRSPGRGNGNPLQYSCLKNHMDRGAWKAIVQRVTKSQAHDWVTKYTHLEEKET